ncbi:hypothetical protein HP436_00280 [Pseudomonas sp. CrR14]|nr:hypothetical protein [Pseudomonas sp. CrR14]
MNIFERLVDHYDGHQTKTASALGVSQAAVSGWVSGKHGMSVKTALRAEKATAGVFKAAELCPDLLLIEQPAA